MYCSNFTGLIAIYFECKKKIAIGISPSLHHDAALHIYRKPEAITYER